MLAIAAERAEKGEEFMVAAIAFTREETLVIYGGKRTLTLNSAI